MPTAHETITTILFDWDGTLADSATMGYIAFEKAFGELGLSFSHDTYERIYSPNWYSMYEALGLPRSRYQRADDLWIRHYGEGPLSLVEGGSQTLVELRHREYVLGVVTSGSESRVRREIDQLSLTSAFQVVICNEDTVNKKPHPEALEKAMDSINKSPEVCAYVGDCPEDIEMGRQASVLTVGVCSEYPSSKRLPNARPDIYLESVVQLLDYF